MRWRQTQVRMKLVSSLYSFHASTHFFGILIPTMTKTTTKALQDAFATHRHKPHLVMGYLFPPPLRLLSPSRNPFSPHQPLPPTPSTFPLPPQRLARSA